MERNKIRFIKYICKARKSVLWFYSKSTEDGKDVKQSGLGPYQPGSSCASWIPGKWRRIYDGSSGTVGVYPR